MINIRAEKPLNGGRLQWPDSYRSFGRKPATDLAGIPCSTGLRIVDHTQIYRDNDISATSGARRQAFEQLLTDLPERVVYRHQDRLERGSDDLERFLLSGIEGYGTDGSRATLESASGEFMTRIKSLVSAHEGRVKAERIKAASKRNATLGKYRGSIRPFGQTRTGERVETEAVAVEWAVEFLLSSEADPDGRRRTFYSVAREWNSRGLLTPQTGKQGGREWTPGTVRNYFSRPRLYGKQEYEGKLYDLKDWTPLLTEDRFNQIQSVNLEERQRYASDKPRERSDAHLLTSLLRCGECGRGMNIAYRNGKGSGRFYKCPSLKHTSVVAVPVEEHVVRKVVDLLSRREQLEGGPDLEALRSLRTQRTQLIASHQTWMVEAAEEGLSPKPIKVREGKHRADVEKMDAQILGLQDSTGGDLVLANEGFPYADPTEMWADRIKYAEANPAKAFEQLPMSTRREHVSSVYRSVLVAPTSQGKRFDAERLTFELTAYGERLRDLEAHA